MSPMNSATKKTYVVMIGFHVGSRYAHKADAERAVAHLRKVLRTTKDIWIDVLI